MEVKILRATKAHAHMMQYQARDADRAEFLAATGKQPFDSIMDGIEKGDFAAAGFVNDELVCIFGIAPAAIIGNVGAPWLISSRNIEKHGRVFLRECRRYMDELAASYGLLINYVDARHTDAIRWLRWLGFTVAETPVPYGVMGLPFHKFTRVK